MQIKFEAVKEQLKLLGHDVPDAVIQSYLLDLSQRNAGEEQEDQEQNDTHNTRASEGPAPAGASPKAASLLSKASATTEPASSSTVSNLRPRQPSFDAAARPLGVYPALSPRYPDAEAPSSSYSYSRPSGTELPVEQVFRLLDDDDTVRSILPRSLLVHS